MPREPKLSLQKNNQTKLGIDPVSVNQGSSDLEVILPPQWSPLPPMSEEVITT